MSIPPTVPSVCIDEHDEALDVDIAVHGRTTCSCGSNECHICYPKAERPDDDYDEPYEASEAECNAAADDYFAYLFDR